MTGDVNFVRSRLFIGRGHTGQRSGSATAGCFLLDDVQWADADTLEMVHYVARRWTEWGAPVLLLLTVRQERFAADSALREWLTRLERDVHLT